MLPPAPVAVAPPTRTVALKVTLPPVAEGLGDPARAVVVAVLVATTWVTVAETLGT